MAAVQQKNKDLGGVEGEAPKAHRIRITLTSQNVPALEKGALLRLGAAFIAALASFPPVALPVAHPRLSPPPPPLIPQCAPTSRSRPRARA